jgi:large subunit ribosomal protein L23
MKSPLAVLKRYRITEKASALNANLNKYVFEVSPQSDKGAVARAVSEQYKTKVARVNILNHPGKRKSGRTMGGHPGRTPRRKMAIVTLEAGQKIEII